MVRLRQSERNAFHVQVNVHLLILLGILAVIVGVIAIAWPGVTILALVILFAIYAFMAAGLQGARAFSSRRAGPVVGHLLLGLIDLAAGVVALVWPEPTAFVLVIVVAAWALVSGIAEVFAGFGSGETAGTRTMFIVAGLVSVAFGVVFLLLAVGAVTQILLFRFNSRRVALAGLGLLLAALVVIVAALSQAAMALFLAGTIVGGWRWVPSSWAAWPRPTAWPRPGGAARPYPASSSRATPA